MENYVMVKMNELNKLCEQFKKEFGVDLNDKKYSDILDLESRWNAVIKDAFGRTEEKTWKEVVGEILYYRDCLYSSAFVEAGKEDCEYTRDFIRKQNQTKLLALTEECRTLINRYLLYEPDVWINAFFSIEYVSKHEKVGRYIDWNNFDMKGYCFPFTYYENDTFCKEGRNILYSKKKEIFGTQYQIECLRGISTEWEELKRIDREKGVTIFSGNNIPGLYRIDIRYPYDANFTRWSYGKMIALEEQMLRLPLEDKILFYFTTNTKFVRNILGFWAGDYKPMKLAEYRELLHKSNRVKSFAWQNFICIFFIGLYEKLGSVLDELDQEILTVAQANFEDWMKHYEEINQRLKLLTAGLICMSKNTEEELSFIKEKCERHLMELEFDNHMLTMQIENETEQLEHLEGKTRDKLKLRISNENTGRIWEYAFLQMETINVRSRYNVQKEEKR